MTIFINTDTVEKIYLTDTPITNLDVSCKRLAFKYTKWHKVVSLGIE